MPPRGRSGYNDEQLSFDALWAEPEHARDEQVRPHGDRHWQKTDPDRYRAIPESEREPFFSDLGDRAESEIQQLQDAWRARTRWGRPTWRRRVG